MILSSCTGVQVETEVIRADTKNPEESLIPPPAEPEDASGIDIASPTSDQSSTPSASPPPSTLAPTQTPTPSLTPTPVQEVTSSPGEQRNSPTDGMVQVFVPESSFLMGSNPEDGQADADESPQHLVHMDAYWIDQTEVTNTMYAAFLNQAGNQLENRAYWLDAGDEDAQVYQNNGVWFVIKGFELHPVVEITWYGARAYCQWAGRRLPTEAEWEFAARGEDGRRYPWGDKADCNLANTVECRRKYALPVGSLPDGASPFGVMEMSGNLWEWVSDWYAADYYSIAPLYNPTGTEEGEFRVLRGGSFGQDRYHARTTNRRNNGPGNSQFDYGFRCAQDAGEAD